MEDLLEYWSREIGSNFSKVERVGRGNNSNIDILTGSDLRVVVKSFNSSDGTEENRFIAERDMLIYANRVAREFVPKLYKIDRKTKSLAMEYIECCDLEREDVPSDEEVETALEFFRVLNRSKDLAKRVITSRAREGYLCLSEHMVNVNQRIDSLSTRGLGREQSKDAEVLIAELKSQRDGLFKTIEKRLSIGHIQDRIDEDCSVISPGDFGFHNILRCKERLVFLDFEYSGWDDPAKAYIDFWLQPEVPVGSKHSTTKARSIFRIPEHYEERTELLEKILRLKWACIVLSVFNPKRLNHIIERNGSGGLDGLLHDRMLKAKYFLKYGE